MSYPTYFYPPDPRQQPYPPRPDVPGYPQQPPQPSAQAPQAMQGLSPASRLVTSREEAMGVAADFSGAPMVFPDIANGRVFIKRWNFQTGAADFLEYAPVLRPEQQQSGTAPAAFASIQEVQDLRDLVENLRAEVDRLKNPSRKAAKKNDSDDE